MSVFKKLKGTFQTAQQDFVVGLRSLTLFDGHPKSAQFQHIISKEINLDVGADLLYEYQEVWSNIQNETKLCANKAEEVDAILTPMFTVWDKRTGDVVALEDEVKSIPGILTTLKDLHTLLESLHQDFSIAESSLSILENLCEEQDLKKAMDEETKKLNIYRNLKEKELEKIKVNLARNHAKKMQDIESTKSQKMKERVEAFTSAFEEDVDYYKTHGRPESKLVTEFPKVSSLSEIDIVEDRKELDTFLGPHTEEEQDAGGEEHYFEDDYTSDFSVKEDLEAPDSDEDLFLPRDEDKLFQETDDMNTENGEEHENFDNEDSSEIESAFNENPEPKDEKKENVSSSGHSKENGNVNDLKS